MSYYAQTNYQQLQGMTVKDVHPKYSIHDIGCFITSFCNLEARFGSPIAPDALDNALAARELYLDTDDGVYDDVGWSTLCSYDPTIAISAIGTGRPTSNDSIVKFIYVSPNTHRTTTHFCLVLNAAAGTIIDSWDGQVKSWDVYGGPREWASYVKAKPQPVTPVQGGVMPTLTTKADLDFLYLTDLGRPRGEGEGEDVYLNKDYKFVDQDLYNSKEAKTRRAANDKLVADLQQKLADKAKEVVDADDANANLKTDVATLTKRQGELSKIIQVQQTQLLANNCTTTVSIKQAVQVLVQAFKDWIK